MYWILRLWFSKSNLLLAARVKALVNSYKSPYALSIWVSEGEKKRQMERITVIRALWLKPSDSTAWAMCWHTQTCSPSLVQRRDINQQPRGWDLHRVNIKHSFGMHQILTGNYQESVNQGSFRIGKRLPFSVQSFSITPEVVIIFALLSHYHSALCCLSGRLGDDRLADS